VLQALLCDFEAAIGQSMNSPSKNRLRLKAEIDGM